MGNLDYRRIPYTLRALVEHVGDDVEILWIVEGYDGKELDDVFESYTIARNSLYGCGAKIRETLSELQSILPIEDGSDPSVLDPVIRRLAFDGAELYSILMSGRPGDSSSIESANEFRSWFEGVVDGMPHGNWRIQVEHKLDSEGVLPWGLVFRPPPGRDINDLSSSIEDMNGFWCTKYFLACSGSVEQESARRLTGEQKFHLGAIIEIDELKVNEFFERGVVTSGLEKDNFSDYFASSTKMAHDISKEFPNYNKFWYISLRAKGGNYQFKGREVDDSLVSSTELGVEDHGVGMILLDGDAVIRGDRGPDWVKRILAASNLGMIAVETDIDNPKLKFCGWDILRSALRERKEHRDLPPEDFIHAIYRTRLEFWPLSLLYGVYSNPLHLFPAPPHRATRKISEYLDFLKNRAEEARED